MTGTITLIARTVSNHREVTAPSRSVTAADSAALARLLLEAYGTQGTGTPEKAESLIQDAFNDAYGPFLAEQSQLIEDEDGNPVGYDYATGQYLDEDLGDGPAEGDGKDKA